MLKNITIALLCASIFVMYIRELRLTHPLLGLSQIEITNTGLKATTLNPMSYFSTSKSIVEKYNEQNAIIISGPITDETAVQFQKALTDDVELVIIASPGGELGSATKISKLIFSHKLATLVPKHSMCYSACTMIFQAGSYRLAYADSMFMYHSAKEVNEKTGEARPDNAATSFYWAYLLLFGINDDLLSQIGDMTADYYITAPNSVKYNIVNKIIPLDSASENVYIN